MPGKCTASSVPTAPARLRHSTVLLSAAPLRRGPFQQTPVVPCVRRGSRSPRCRRVVCSPGNHRHATARLDCVAGDERQVTCNIDVWPYETESPLIVAGCASEGTGYCRSGCLTYAASGSLPRRVGSRGPWLLLTCAATTSRSSRQSQHLGMNETRRAMDRRGRRVRL
jgi:hypothetical protein